MIWLKENNYFGEGGRERGSREGVARGGSTVLLLRNDGLLRSIKFCKSQVDTNLYSPELLFLMMHLFLSSYSVYYYYTKGKV